MKVLILSDPHCGSVFGLTPPQWQRPKNWGFQKPLWEWFDKRIKHHAPFDLVLFLGDAVEGGGMKGSLDIEPNNPMEQGEMAIEWMKGVPLKKNGQWEFCFGTPFHGTSVYKHEDPVAEAFGKKAQKTLRLDLDGVKVNAEHTGKRSDTAWGQGTQTSIPAVKDELRAHRRGEQSAQIYYRAHVHYYYMTSWKSTSVVRAYNVPCLKYPYDDFAIKLDPIHYDIGFMVHDFKDGKLIDESLEFFDWEKGGKEWEYKKM